MSNTFSGPTYLDNGYLLVTGSLLSSGKVEVASGGDLWGSGTVGNVDVNSGGLLFPNVDGSANTTLKTGKVWFGSGSTFTVCIGQSVNASGSVDLSNGPTLNAHD